MNTRKTKSGGSLQQHGSTAALQGEGWSQETGGEPTSNEWRANRVRLFAWWLVHEPKLKLAYRFWLRDGSVWEMRWLATMNDTPLLMPLRYIIKEYWRPKPGVYYNGSCRCVQPPNTKLRHGETQA